MPKGDYGRDVLLKHIHDGGAELINVTREGTVLKDDDKTICTDKAAFKCRCGSIHTKKIVSITQTGAYCIKCARINMVKNTAKTINKDTTDYNKELLDRLLHESKSPFKEAYKHGNKLEDLSKLSKECDIHGTCPCGAECSNRFVNIRKQTGLYCKKCTTKKAVELRRTTNKKVYGHPVALHGDGPKEKTKQTLAENKKNRPLKPYHKRPNEVRLGIKDKNGCIYLITCLANGKQYVGLSKNETPDERYKEHWHTRNDTSNTKPILHKAMDLYGKEMFTVETLCVVSYDGLYNMEAYYAEQYGTYMWDNPGGYNMVWCGIRSNLGIPLSEKTRALISEKAKNRSPETKQRYSDAAKKRNNSNRKPRKAGKTGEQYIQLVKNRYRVIIKDFYKSFLTLEEAIKCRDEFIASKSG